MFLVLRLTVESLQGVDLIVVTLDIRIGSRSYDGLRGAFEESMVAVLVRGLPIRTQWRLVAVCKARVLLEPLLASHTMSKHTAFTRGRILVCMCSIRASRSPCALLMRHPRNI